jgi:hypothetical protein
MGTIPSHFPLPILKTSNFNFLLLLQRVEKQGTGKGREARENKDLTNPSVCLKGR